MMKEKIKTIVLSILVLTSIFLTTQLWFNISIAGIFDNANIKETNSSNIALNFEKASLIRPNKIIINLGEKGLHSILFNRKESESIYERILQETEVSLKKYLNKEGIESTKVYPIEKLGELRSGRNIEFIYESSLDVETVAYILGIPGDIFDDIKKVDSVIVSPSDSSIYINNVEGKAVYGYKLKTYETTFSNMIGLIESLGPSYSLFLNEAYPELYSPKAVIPIDMKDYKLPALSVKKEFESATDIENIVGKFFDYNSARSIRDSSGTTIYTDGQAKSVRIEQSGLIEYVKYNTETKFGENITKTEAIDIGVNFINQHLGFPEGSYISYIKEIMQNGVRVGFDMGVNYRLLNTPVVLDTNMDNSPIEVEIIGREVKSYKRLVRNINEVKEQKETTNAIDVLNTLYKEINLPGEADKAIVQNMYLGYYEYESRDNEIMMIPAWIVETEHEENGKPVKNQYIINAETSVILKY